MSETEGKMGENSKELKNNHDIPHFFPSLPVSLSLSLCSYNLEDTHSVKRISQLKLAFVIIHNHKLQQKTHDKTHTRTPSV